MKVFHPGNTVEKVTGTTECKDEKTDADDPHQSLAAIVFHLLFTIKHYKKADRRSDLITNYCLPILQKSRQREVEREDHVDLAKCVEH